MTLLDIVLFLPLAGFFALLFVPKGKPGVSRMRRSLHSCFNSPGGGSSCSYVASSRDPHSGQL